MKILRRRTAAKENESEIPTNTSGPLARESLMPDERSKQMHPANPRDSSSRERLIFQRAEALSSIQSIGPKVSPWLAAASRRCRPPDSTCGSGACAGGCRRAAEAAETDRALLRAAAAPLRLDPRHVVGSPASRSAPAGRCLPARPSRPLPAESSGRTPPPPSGSPTAGWAGISSSSPPAPI